MIRLLKNSESGRSRPGSDRLRSFRQFLQERKNELRLATIFLVLIFLPSGLLGYLSWRAIKNEALISQQKIVESYRQFVHLATRDLDNELENVQARLKNPIEKALAHLGSQRSVELIDALVQAEPLITSWALLTGPWRSRSPADDSERREDLSSSTQNLETMAREYELYHELAARGEDLEYHTSHLDSAIAVYRQVLTETWSPRLHAMAHSLFGRAQTKKEDWKAALETYERLLRDYPEERDLNKMHLRFLAQYQIAVCLENLDRHQEAVETLLRMSKDLLERGDTINMPQYSHFQQLTKPLFAEVLSEPGMPARKEYYEQFHRLAAHSKKSVDDRYFVQLLEDELRELVIERKSYRPVIRYFSGQADGEPFLLGYFPTPDRTGALVSGMLGFRVNLTQLRERVLPALLRHLRTSDAVVLALLDNANNFVIGAAKPRSAPIATLALSSPFEFWQVGVFLESDEHPSPLADLSTLLWLWLISGLLFSIFSGAYIFIRYARHEARLSELKSTFVSRVSHELRTPSTSIKMLAEHLEMQLRHTATATELDSRMRTMQYLSVIRRESDRLGRLVENVFDFSKIERGVKQYNLEYELLGVVLQSAIASFRPHAEAQGFQVKSEIDDSLPELLLDADGMTQAILNLLSNAVKYSDKEKIIDVRAYRNGDHAYVEVEDRGIGIPAAQTSRIFEEFYRVDQKLNSKHQGGVGLGLTLVKHIAEAHRGTIEVRSEEGKGSTFVMTLPLLPNESASRAAVPEKTNPLDHQPAEITA